MNWIDQNELLSVQLKFIESEELNQTNYEAHECENSDVLIFFGLTEEIFKFEKFPIKKIVFDPSLNKIKFLSEKLSVDSFDTFYFVQKFEDIERIASWVSFKKISYYYLEEELSNYKLFLLLVENSKLNFQYLIKNYQINLNNFFENILAFTYDFENLKFAEKKSAILIGAGPSLDLSIDEIKNIHKDVYIIACVRAAPLLFRYDIKPDFFAVLDPNEFLRLPDDSYKNIPCFFAPTANPKQIQLFKYKILKSFNSNYPIIEYFQDKLTVKKLQDAGHTVVSFMYRICQELNFCDVTFYGVDLCYSKKRKYHESNKEKDCSNLIETKDSSNNTVWTQKDFLLSKYWFEEEISKNNNCKIFNNSTGLNIRGAFEKKKFRSKKKEKLVLVKLQNKKELLDKIKKDLDSIILPHSDSYLDQLLFFSDLKDNGVYLYIEKWFSFFADHSLKLSEDKFYFFLEVFIGLKNFR